MRRLICRLRRRPSTVTLCRPLRARSLFAGTGDYSGATPEAQKRRSGHIDRVRPTPVGSIFAHKTTVVGQLRAFSAPRIGGRPRKKRPRCSYQRCSSQYSVGSVPARNDSL
jgi:hypothetical protein